ncbi:glycosyltransferase [Candidatus Avelusimicrobium alvi]|uniref:glycosyltransferase n=1 Tax=Candidatus Avelusimicrobium alvi TaxID=3416221 RepID=UPI003D14CDEE
MSIHNFGKRNLIAIESCDAQQLDITVYGSDNNITIAKLWHTGKGKVSIVLYGHFCNIKLEKSIYIHNGLQIRLGKDAQRKVSYTNVTIGKQCSIEQAKIITFHSNQNIIMGQQCMLANNVLIKATDGHPIYNKQGVFSAPGSGIRIGDKVWFGENCVLLKNALVGDGCIVGSHAVVTKPFPQKHCLLAGNPAQKKKQNVFWKKNDPNWLANGKYLYTQFQPLNHTQLPYLLTVYVLTYNHEDSIAKTLNSILEQKTKYPFIITILEDHSTDNTLAICKEFQKKYPSRIHIIAQMKNTKGEHSRWAKEKINTKYWCTLEGDDYWDDETKIETALDVLEENPEYIAFAHDTICRSVQKNYDYSLYHNSADARCWNTGKTRQVSFERPIYIHTSAIIYRHIVDFSQYTLPLIDTYIFFYHLSFGPVFFIDKIMSIHPQTGKGMWSSLSQRQRNYNNEIIHYELNQALGYRFNAFFSTIVRKTKMLRRLQHIFGISVGWKIYIFLQTIQFKLAILRDKLL